MRPNQLLKSYYSEKIEPYLLVTYIQAFFWTFRKKLKAKKTQAEKKLKQIFKKLKQIIPKLNNLPTKNLFFAQKSPENDIFAQKFDQT